MSKTPNFALLKEAYAIIGGIPAEQFDLQDVVRERGKSLKCGTCACAAGWMALHPQMSKKADVYVEGYLLKNRSTNGYESYVIAMSRLFNIDFETADSLFAQRGDGFLGEDPELNFRGSDKQLWMKRVRAYLRAHGQLKSQLAKKAREGTGLA